MRPTSDPADQDSIRKLTEKILDRADSLWQEYESTQLPTLDERYTLCEEIGRGGMGVVYRALDRTLNRDVAIKTIRRRASDVAEVRARFVEEAKVSSSLEHPGIVPIHDLVISADGSPFFVMKLIRGRTLQSILADPKDSSASRRNLLQIFERACQAIAYAHAKNVLHRDIKPSNVMVGEFGEVHVLDWGLVKIAAGTTMPWVGDNSGEFPADATRFGDVLGTAAYMSPEQALGEVQRITTRTDVFNLGAMLLEILTGAPPYPGSDSRSEVRRAREGCRERAAESLTAAGIEPGLRDIVLACLEFDPESRPQDAGELTRRLHDHLASESERIRHSEIAAAQARAAAKHERRARFITMGAASMIVLLAYWTLRSTADAENTRRAHALSNERRIASALHQVELLQADSGRSNSPDLSKLRAALSASEEAAQLALDSAAPADVRDRSVALRDELATLVKEVERDESLCSRLDALRDQADHQPDPGLLRERTLEELAAAGIDVEREETTALATRVRSMRVVGRIVEALDDYLLSQRPSVGLTPLTPRVVAAVNAIDSDPTRSAIREAFARRADDELVRFVGSRIDDLPSETYLLLARALSRLEKSSAAIAIYEVAVRRFPGVARIRHDHAITLGGNDVRRFEQADRELEIAIAIEPENLHFIEDRAILALVADDFAAAADQLAALIERDPLRATSWATIGDLFLEQGEPALANRAHTRAYELDSTTIGIRARRVESLISNARYDEFLRMLEATPGDAPEAKLLPDLLATAYLDNGDFTRAIEFAKIAMQTFPQVERPGSNRYKPAQLLDLATRVNAIESRGGLRPELLEQCSNGDEALAIALFASRRNRFHFATLAYALVERRFPNDFQRIGLSCRMQAIWIALSSGLGLGDDSIALTDEEKRRDRDRARVWLEEEIAFGAQAFEDGRMNVLDTRMFCSYLENNPRMKRAFDALDAAVIPARERLMWDAARADLAALHASLGKVHSVDLDRFLAMSSRAQAAR